MTASEVIVQLVFKQRKENIEHACQAAIALLESLSYIYIFLQKSIYISYYVY